MIRGMILPKVDRGTIADRAVYDVALRPCAHYLLGCLREIGCVSLLTISQRDYAEKISG